MDEELSKILTERAGEIAGEMIKQYVNSKEEFTKDQKLAISLAVLTSVMATAQLIEEYHKNKDKF